MVALKDALYGGEAGQRVDAQPFELAGNRACSNQSILGRWGSGGFQRAADGQHGLFDLWRSLVRLVERSTRVVGKICLGIAAIDRPPFVEPLETAP